MKENTRDNVFAFFGTLTTFIGLGALLSAKVMVGIPLFAYLIACLVVGLTGIKFLTLINKDVKERMKK